MHSNKKRYTAIASFLAATTMLIGCSAGQTNDGQDDTSDTNASTSQISPNPFKESGKLVICSDLNSPPNQYVDSDGVTPTGAALAVVEEAAKELEVEVEVRNFAFSGIFAALDTNQCDAILASTSANPERLEKYNFVFYFRAGSGILAPKEEKYSQIKEFSDLSGLRVGVLIGSKNFSRLQEANDELVAAGKEPIDIMEYDSNTVIFPELELGRIEVMVSDNAVLSYFMNRGNDKFEIVASPVAPTNLGMPIPKANQDKFDALQSAIDIIYENGRMQAVMDEWGILDGVDPCSSSVAECTAN